MNPLKTPGQWRLGAVAGVIALMGSLASLPVHALGLGRIHVQSALGEPLRAEIDIAEISPEEAASLRASIAAPEVFKTAGLEYTAALANLQITLNKRADGRSYLRLTGNRTVSEPFVDLVLEATWASGRIVRDYTMLFDPPALRQQGLAAAPTAPVLSRPAAPAVSQSAAMPAPLPPAQPLAPPAPLPGQTSQQPAPQRAAPPAPVPRPAAQQLAVRSGDTAGGIAAQNKPASVSLDQMLVALLRNNPDAFIGGNVNRLKAGAVLDLPSAEQAGAVTPSEASRTIVAQSRDFNAFRRKLAENVSATDVGSASRASGGQVQAKVEDRAPATATPDKLTLSKGAVQGRATAEDKIARERQASEAAQRTAELSKNISDLNKLGVGTTAATAAAGTRTVPGVSLPVAAAVPAAPASMPAAPAAPAPSMPATAVSTPSTAISASAAPQTAASAAIAAASAATAADTTATSPALSAASAPADAASAPVSADAAAAAAALPASTPASAATPAPAKAPAPVAEPGLLDELTQNPLLLPGLGLLLALLGGLGYYKYRNKRNNQAQVDSSFLESRLQPDSFFGASGGQRVDTNEGGATGSSLVYSPSQLDAAGDVDPVAEADVYLAYGRDLQAEEILKEAMRTNPTRVAIHSKLLEIYAKRRDARAFEVVAVEAFNLTNGEGPEWTYIGEIGRELDPANPMYQPGGQPAKGERVNAAEAAHAAASAGFSSSTIPQMIEPERPVESAATPSLDFDLDLDFSLGDEPVAAAPAAAPAPAPAPAPAAASRHAEATMPIAAAPEAIFKGLDMDFSADTFAIKPQIARQDVTPSRPAAPAVDPVLSASGLTFNAEPQKTTPAASFAAAPEASDSGMLEFDLGSLSLDLDASTPGGTAAAGHDDPLETKFALAEEFRSLGDPDGARSLAEEVVAEAKGSLKTKAQAFLTSLS